MALLSVLARLGTSQPIEPVADLSGLSRTFDFSHFGRAPAHFDLHDVELINARLLHETDFDGVAERLPEGATEQDWLLLRHNLNRLDDFAGWFAIIDGDIAAPKLADEDRLFLEQAAAAAEAVDWAAEPWRALTDALKQSSGRKGKALFLPLRLALTGQEHGPEMGGMVTRIGKDRALARLRGAAESR
jgi:glutamyl-tRNA synthetase